MSGLPRALVLFALVVAAAVGPAAAGSLDDLLLELQLVLLADRIPPPLGLEALDGGTVTLEALKGRVLLLYFWATW